MLRVAVGNIQTDERNLHNRKDISDLLKVLFARASTDGHVRHHLGMCSSPGRPLLHRVVLVHASNHLVLGKRFRDLEGTHGIPERV